DLVPEAKTKDKKDLKLVSATNIIDDIDSLKDNEESVRAIFVSDKLIDKMDVYFKIKDKLGEVDEHEFEITIN
ncbi:MAG: hypothetical protein Q4A76_06805, partial [Porphyromonadaceae bacterium]|nr:hypothetical protein [Porphyromonadaceae bacterium]